MSEQVEVKNETRWTLEETADFNKRRIYIRMKSQIISATIGAIIGAGVTLGANWLTQSEDEKSSIDKLISFRDGELKAERDELFVQSGTLKVQALAFQKQVERLRDEGIRKQNALNVHDAAKRIVLLFELTNRFAKMTQDANSLSDILTYFENRRILDAERESSDPEKTKLDSEEERSRAETAKKYETQWEEVTDRWAKGLSGSGATGDSPFASLSQFRELPDEIVVVQYWAAGAGSV
jgi:hypothetical protein